MKKYILFLLAALVLLACKEEKEIVDPNGMQDLSEYYFPYKNLDEGLVYEYELLNDTEVVDVFYAVLEPTRASAFFYKYYDHDFNIKDSIYYAIDNAGVYVGYRYVMYKGVWNRVLFDHNSYFHKNKRSVFDTTKTKLQTMNQYGRLLTNEMKIYFNGFDTLKTPYYDEEKVSVIKIESDLVSKEHGEKEGTAFKEITTVYNAKGIGTIMNVNENEFGKQVYRLKRVLKKDEFLKEHVKRTPAVQ